MPESLYERVGGTEAFTRLAERFYEGVATDPILRPMYPDDLAPAAERLALFLAQVTGGPRTYEERRGDARLRYRHLRFPIDEAAMQAWLGHMHAAVATLGLASEDAEELVGYLDATARFLINRGLSIVGSS